MSKRLSYLAACLFAAAAGMYGATPTKAAPKPAAKPAIKAPAHTVPAAEKVTTVEGITEYHLGNGLRVLLFPDQTKPTITVNLVYLVGSRFESYGETGMAHLLEHMMFKGTPTHTNIPQALKSHGAIYNASTWYDRTNYFEILPASQENLDFALDLESDRMVHSYIAKKDLDSEMTVVRNEFEAGENDPENILTERSLSTAYLWHNYGKSTIGARADIEGVPIERLQAFWRKYYQPDNAVLLIAGKFDADKALASVEHTFGKIPAPTRKIEVPYTMEPAQDGPRETTLRRVGDIQALTAVYHIPAGSDPDAAPMEMLDSILTNAPSGRLYKALVETKKATSVGSFMPGLHDPGFIVFSVELRQEQSIDEARAILTKTLDELGQNPPTKEEVDRARAEYLKDFDLQLNSADRVGIAMSEYIAMGDWRLMFLDRDRVKKVTPEDVLRVANAYLKPSNRTVGEFIPDPKPDRAQVPPAPDVAAMVKDYKGQAAVAEGEAFDPSPSNIESRTTRSSVGGVKIALLPKKTRGETVIASMTIHYGTEQALMNRSEAADGVGEMLMRGTTKHTRQQIKDAFDLLKTRVRITGGVTQSNVYVETTKENLAASLDLAAEVLKEPSFPPAEFDTWKQEQLASIEQEKSDPNSLDQIAFGRHMNPYPKGHPLYTSTVDEQLESTKALTLDEVKKFYSDFYGASNAEIAVVGDFDAKTVSSQIATLFQGWKSPAPFTRVNRIYQDVPPANEAIKTPDKANALFLAGQNIAMRDDDPDYPALVVGNYILGGGTLYSRLGNRIRQKEGLSYGVSSFLNVSPLDKVGSFVTFAIYAPQNEAKLETAFKEEVDLALKTGFTADEVTEAKKGLLETRKVQRAQDAQLARNLSIDLFYNRTLAFDANLESKIAALTQEQVNSAMKKWLDSSKMSIFKAGDFDKKPDAAPAAAPKS